jgi:hypothetical protein
LNVSVQGDSSRFHYHIVIDDFAAIHPRRNLFDRSAQRDGEVFVIAIKTAIAQSG